jgi:hypothetical protein
MRNNNEVGYLQKNLLIFFKTTQSISVRQATQNKKVKINNISKNKRKNDNKKSHGKPKNKLADSTDTTDGATDDATTDVAATTTTTTTAVINSSPHYVNNNYGQDAYYLVRPVRIGFRRPRQRKYNGSTNI